MFAHAYTWVAQNNRGDILVTQFTGYAEHHALLNATMSVDDFFYLRRQYVFTSVSNHILLAAEKVQVTVFVELSDVTGV